VNSESSSYLDDQYPDSLGSDAVSIALIGPDEERRKAAVSALAGCQGGEIREFSSYPPSLDDVPRLLEQHYDVIIIDLDSYPEYALELVESICANGLATVMVYSMKTDPDLLVRCMRAGAREFLTLPFAQSTMAEALIRAAARRPAVRTPKKAGGRLLVFLGAKGGDGVTTLACNFAVALAQESSKSTLLIDLDLPLGDAALNLGISADYSTVNALQNSGRLDSSFLSKLLVKHSSGVSVLAAPGKFPQFNAPHDAVDRLISVARQDFDNVVVDMGSRLDLAGTSLFKDGSTVYLVIQASVAGLRNSNRVISQFFTTEIPRLEIVINRFEPRGMGVAEDQITKALTRPVQWKIPNDYSAVRRMQSTAVPLAMEDSPISRLIRQMARTACGLPATPEKRSLFRLKSLSRSISAKVPSIEQTPAIASLGLAIGQAAPSAAPDVAADKDALRTGNGEASLEKSHSVSPSERQDETVTRTYKGATYVKGADGEWHLQKIVTSGAIRATPAITWFAPASIACGDALGSAQLNATSSVPGKFTYSPAAGELLKAGMHTLSVTFTPDSTTEYNSAQASVKLVVSKATPEIEWPEPASIACGDALGSAQLNATASVPGEFTYSPAAGELLKTGTHTLSVTFTPDSTTEYNSAQASVKLVVSKATPEIEWPEPATIVYGAALSATELNATSPVPGKFTYSPAAGELLNSGMHTLSATFTPDDAAEYSTAQSSAVLIVSKATPEINWPEPATIVYGAALSATELNAAASVPGKFTYSPAAGELLNSGMHTLSATFTPDDAAEYSTAQSSAVLIVSKATPEINWPEPASIVYGAALGTAQLNATASVPGKFVYIPSAGAVLAAGTHTPSAIFTPEDTDNHTAAQAAVRLLVSKAAPVITWPDPASIPYGVALDTAQLNATASVPGAFVYSPAAGELLQAGMHTLSATFTPMDVADYALAEAAVSLSVAEAKPTTIAWPEPAPLAHGTALSAEQLNATAPIPGTFLYTPAAGEVLATGTHTLSVTFTPVDTNLPAAQASVQLAVTKAEPIITLPAPTSIAYGTALSAAQLNATASVPGTFVYDPAAGAVLRAGTHTLSVTFTPADGVGFSTTQASAQLVVTKATPIVTWTDPKAVSYGTALSATQLNARALVRGTFVYTPDICTVLPAGKHMLSVTLLPMESADFATAQATVPLVIEELPNIASLMPASADQAANRTELTPPEPPEMKGGSAPPAPVKPSELETRSYKGATYVKGDDGQWYLQKK
jgi:Flp pilus assembly CpaE family ATPase